MIRVEIENIRYYNKLFKKMFTKLKEASPIFSSEEEKIGEKVNAVTELTDFLLELLKNVIETEKKLIKVKKAYLYLS